MLKRLERESSLPLPSLSDRAPLKFQFERLAAIAREIAPLMVLHWRGAPEPYRRVPLDIDWTRAFVTDEMGHMHILTARDGERLVGYVINHVVNPVMHNGSKWSFVEGIFLLPEYREGWNGYNLIKKNDKGMKMLGVNVIKFYFPVNTFEVLLRRLKYEFLEAGAFKFLGDQK